MTRLCHVPDDRHARSRALCRALGHHNDKSMEKHDLLHEFPEFKTKIHDLKTSDHHFRRLFDDYHAVDHEIHSIETGAQVTTDEHLNELRKRRVHLKDELFLMLQGN
jgi:uncharacterized protein YdcH (DUF465 family)